jgi:cation transport protein ChaC
MTAGGGDLWVFGYGSLMWRPGFEAVERAPARLTGWHRSFCITSTHHRGSPERPGLVLGLDRGGACEGVAYRVAATQADAVHRYLRVRELVNGVYREVAAPVELGDGRRVRALTYIVERAHPSYAGGLSLPRQAFLIRGARGLSGDNLDYLINTVRALQTSGIRERALERLVALASPLTAQRSASSVGTGLVSPTAQALRRTVARQPLVIRRLPKGERRRFVYRMRLTGV